MKTKRILSIALMVGALLLIPFIGMQFSEDVDWSGFDFLIMGILLLATGLLIDLALRKIPDTKNRIIVSGIILVVFLLVWAELAVGIFGTPLAGS